MAQPKYEMTDEECEAYCRGHVDKAGTVVFVSVVHGLIRQLDRERVRVRELTSMLVAEVEHEPADHLPIRGRDACLVPHCRCPTSQRPDAATPTT